MDFDLKKVEKCFLLQECLDHLYILISMIPAVWPSMLIALPGCGGIRGGEDTFLDGCDCNIQMEGSQHLQA